VASHRKPRQVSRERRIRLVVIKPRNRCGRKKEEEERKNSRVKFVSPSSQPRKMAPSCFEVILVGFILVLPFLYETSRTFRYYFKFLIYYGIVIVVATLFLPIFSLRPGNVKNFVLVTPIDRYYYVATFCTPTHFFFHLSLRLYFNSFPDSPSLLLLSRMFLFLSYRSFLTDVAMETIRPPENLLTGARCM